MLPQLGVGDDYNQRQILDAYWEFVRENPQDFNGWAYLIQVRVILDFSVYVRYSTLPHLPPLRFHCVGECWDRTQDCCDFGIDSQTL
jgi:hypothetical protein